MGISSPINSSIPSVFIITRDYVGIVATTAMSSPNAPAIAVHIDSVGECACAPVSRAPCNFRSILIPTSISRISLRIPRIFSHNKRSHFGRNPGQADFQFADHFLFRLACALCMASRGWSILAAPGTLEIAVLLFKRTICFSNPPLPTCNISVYRDA